jgi:hypothetical protein
MPNLLIGAAGSVPRAAEASKGHGVARSSHGVEDLGAARQGRFRAERHHTSSVCTPCNSVQAGFPTSDPGPAGVLPNFHAVLAEGRHPQSCVVTGCDTKVSGNRCSKFTTGHFKWNGSGFSSTAHRSVHTGRPNGYLYRHSRRRVMVHTVMSHALWIPTTSNAVRDMASTAQPAAHRAASMMPETASDR